MSGPRPAASPYEFLIREVSDALVDGASMSADRADMLARTVVSRFPLVRWERDVNARGIAVRRPLMGGAWEVDPAPPGS